MQQTPMIKPNTLFIKRTGKVGEEEVEDMKKRVLLEYLDKETFEISYED